MNAGIWISAAKLLALGGNIIGGIPIDHVRVNIVIRRKRKIYVRIVGRGCEAF